MSTQTQAETAASVEPVELTERQQVMKTHREQFTFAAGKRRLVFAYRPRLQMFKDGFHNVRPVAVYDPQRKTYDLFKSVEIKGESRLVPFADSMVICGENEPNHLAVETEAEIIGRY